MDVYSVIQNLAIGITSGIFSHKSYRPRSEFIVLIIFLKAESTRSMTTDFEINNSFAISLYDFS